MAWLFVGLITGFLLGVGLMLAYWQTCIRNRGK